MRVLMSFSASSTSEQAARKCPAQRKSGPDRSVGSPGSGAGCTRRPLTSIAWPLGGYEQCRTRASPARRLSGQPPDPGRPIVTPNYDRMAAQGLRYNRFHVTAMCSPTRAALLTGRNHHSVGPQSGSEPPSVLFATSPNAGRRMGNTVRSTRLLPRGHDRTRRAVVPVLLDRLQPRRHMRSARPAATTCRCSAPARTGKTMLAERCRRSSPLWTPLRRLRSPRSTRWPGR